MRKYLLAVVGLACVLTACATTSEMPLAPNMVRLDTNASGLIFTSTAGAITMKKAAEATIRRGYTHFRLEQAQTASGSRFVGMNTYGSGTAQASVYGNTAYGTYSGSSFSTPMYAPTASIGVTVIMFHANEAGAKGAFDAAEVLKKNGNI
ncbi:MULTISPECIES: hypothetical protein [Rhizobium]|uniref:Lipoprotein n=1 Tax=Rhizobium leguminosarum TaxID=384 RepID=A0A6P0DG02_RHILE|nr:MULTISPECIES: hypothetical protein [Rhizobium]MDH6658798.1 hypothetical protein [Rhizobium sophorae]ASS55268.1 hypothetical protein CHR56_12240 [Rhizobium leguminosarum bv. viciae]MBB4342370.1 hypothetical protein [Rhizobium leguminosarum]MBB4521670.1 hypothetical protein [Rhizobium leguminosarum]MBB6294994.1 hypothetical protein [Rhizobium leguminosarum]